MLRKWYTVIHIKPQMKDFRMKGKFTQASKKDKFLVTTRLKSLVKPKDLKNLNKGDELILVVEGVPTVFTVNRKDLSTAATNAFPRKLVIPQVGNAIEYTVNDVFFLEV